MNDLARDLYAAYNSHDLAAVAVLYAPDATHTDVSQGRVQAGPAEIANGLGRFFQWFPDVTWTPQHAIVDPSGGIAIPYTMTATLQSAMGPILASGQAISIRGVHVLRTVGGQIASSEDYWDSATFQRQINPTNKENR